jgi:carbon starvation protein
VTPLLAILAAAVVLWGGGHLYARFVARRVGEDAGRLTPAVRLNDGRDYVPTPTPVVFAHHFASIAGAGPIIGPVIAIVFGWLPAVLWICFGGILIGAVHDYLAAYMSLRQDGQSVATIARRLMGRGVFLAFVFFLIVSLALVCAAFLNLSATALTSMLPFARLEMPESQTLFRVAGSGSDRQIVIGGVASMSVIVITALAPLLGWMYIRRQVAVWKCSILAVVICAVSIVVGVYLPVALSADVWMILLSIYVLVAAGVPVWIFLQSRDFINVHMLYVGMAVLGVTLAAAALRAPAPADPLPALDIARGETALGAFWPALFITIACGAVSGFHSLCAGGTTCKQLVAEPAARRVGYYGMLLESFLALCVIAVMMIGTSQADYLADVHPKMVGAAGASNPILGFAVAVGTAGKIAFGIPVAVGALAGMILLEGFLVTTLDTAVRLTRYLIEEIWQALFERYDVFAPPAAAATAVPPPAGGCGLPAALPADGAPAPAAPIPTSGAFRTFLRTLRHYWINSGLAVGLTLIFALTGGVAALWGIFATCNQLLAAMVLFLASVWLIRQGRRFLFAAIPAVLMLVTTVASLIQLLRTYLQDPGQHATLLVADLVVMGILAYLLVAGTRLALRLRRGASS